MNAKSVASSASVGSSSTRSESHSGLEAALVVLRTGDFQSRWDVAKAIPAFGEMAIPPLLDLLQGSDIDISNLDTSKTEQILEHDADEDSDWELLWFVARILGSFNHPIAINALIDILFSTTDPDIVVIAANTLATFGLAAVPALTELLHRDSTKLIAVQALAQVQDSAVIPALLNAVEDADPKVRSAAIEALCYFQDVAITTVLQNALQDPAASVRRAAVIALGMQTRQQHSAEVTQLISPLLWDLNLDVCQQAAISLGRVGTEAAITVLSQALQSAHTPLDLQVEIVRALAWIGTAAALEPLKCYLDSPPTPSASLELEQEIITVLGRVDTSEARPIAVNLLLYLLKVRHPIAQTSQGKRHIALSLGQLQNPSAIDPLIALLADADVAVQLHAIAALKQLTLQGSYERLQALAAEPDRVQPSLQAGIALALQEWTIHFISPDL